MLWLSCLLSACLAAGINAAAGAPMESIYDWHVTLRYAYPDCFGKETIVVNGVFQPTITVRQGEVLQVRETVSRNI